MKGVSLYIHYFNDLEKGWISMIIWPLVVMAWVKFSGRYRAKILSVISGHIIKY